MADGQDPLFGGMTRPTLLWGIPPAALGVIFVGPLFGVIITRNLVFATAIPVLYGIFRAICAKDPRQLRYIGLSFLTHRRGANKRVWKLSSYAPTRFRKR
jgi:type IV secretion system protein VirB3